MMYKLYASIVMAAVANLGCIYFMKLSKGQNLSWATFAMVLCSMILLYFLRITFSGGVNIGVAVTILNVSVMIGALGLSVIFGEKVTIYQGVGVAVALAGIGIANIDAMRAA